MDVLLNGTLNVMKGRTAGLPAQLASAPHRVVKPTDGLGFYAHPRPQFTRLAHRGLLRRLATGYYAVVPPDRTGDEWVPLLEDAAFGIAAADYGGSAPVLMGLSAARLHGAVPRALAVAVVAVPKQRPPLTLLDRPAVVLFVRRDTSRLDAVRFPRAWSRCLVTGVEQTVLDLARRPNLGGLPQEAETAVRALLPRCDQDVLALLATEQRLGAARRRALALAS